MFNLVTIFAIFAGINIIATTLNHIDDTENFHRLECNNAIGCAICISFSKYSSSNDYANMSFGHENEDVETTVLFCSIRLLHGYYGP